MSYTEHLFVFEANIEKNRKMREICSKLAMKTAEQGY